MKHTTSMTPRVMAAFVAVLALTTSFPSMTLADNLLRLPVRLQPIAKDSGFRMKDFFVWCGSAIRVGDTCHLFAARWPKATGFPDGYRTHSEIVRATADKPEGPYTFQEVVLGKRPAGKWDSAMAHNPAIYKVGDTFVLYYIGSDEGSRYREIGIATAPAVTGPWTRSDRPLDLGVKSDANNPAAYFEPDGSVKLIWRDKSLRVFISTAGSFHGPYQVANDNVWPACKIEDFYFFKHDRQYHVVCEDSTSGVTGHDDYGAHLISNNGIDGWKKADPPFVYKKDYLLEDGTVFRPSRRERPWFLEVDGKFVCLFNSVAKGKDHWNQAVRIEPPLEIRP